MRPEVKKYLYDMQQACRAAADFLAGQTLDSYQHNEMLRSAVERKLMIIGEALGQALRIDPDHESQIPDARQIIDFRNIIVHGYYAIKHETVWGILQKDLPILIQNIDHLLNT